MKVLNKLRRVLHKESEFDLKESSIELSIIMIGVREREMPAVLSWRGEGIRMDEVENY